MPPSLIPPSGTTTRGLTPSSLTLPWGCSVGPSSATSPPWPHPPGAGEHPLGPLWFLPVPFHRGAQMWTPHCRRVPHGVPHQYPDPAEAAGALGMPPSPGDVGFLPSQACLPGLLGYKYLPAHTAWRIFSSGKGGGGFPTAISAYSSSPRGTEQLGQAGPAPHGRACRRPWRCAGLSPALSVSQIQPRSASAAVPGQAAPQGWLHPTG